MNCVTIADPKPCLVSTFSISNMSNSPAVVVDLKSVGAFKCNWGRSSDPAISGFAIKIHPKPTPDEVICKVVISSTMTSNVKNVWILETKP